MNRILPLLLKVEHIKVDAKHRKKVEALIRKHEKRHDWVYWFVPIVVAIIALIGLLKMFNLF